MKRQKSIRLLVIESNEDDLLLVQEALAEMDEASYWRTWMRPCQPVFVRTLKGAVSALGREGFEAALLSIELPDAAGVEPLLRLREEAPDLPIVVLANPDEEHLAQAAVREGAQDYLLKNELDCQPLARCLRYAIERQILRTSLRRMSFWDESTGLYSLSGFLNMAEHHMALLARLNRAMTVTLADLEGLDELRAHEGRQAVELSILEAADILRGSFHEADLVASLGAGRFAILTLDTEHLRARQELAAARLSHWNKRRRKVTPLFFCFGDARLEPNAPLSLEELLRNAEQALCENRRSYLAPLREVRTEPAGDHA